MFRRFLKKYGWAYIPGILFLVLTSRVKTWLPAALGTAIDMLTEPIATRPEVYRQALRLFLLALLAFVTTGIWRLCVIGNARRMEIFLRMEYFTKLQSLPVSFFSKQRSGDLIAYAINDVNAVRMMFGPVLSMSVNGIVTAVLSITAMAADVDYRMTLLALIPLPISVYCIISLGTQIRKRSRTVQGLFSKISGFVNESIMGIRIVKSFSREREWSDDFGAISSDMRDANVRLTDTHALINPAVTVTFAVSFVVSMIYGSRLVTRGAITVGDLVAFQSYLALVQMPVIQLGRIVNMIQRGRASYKRLDEILSEPSIPETEFAPYEKEIVGEIEFRDLTFTYPGQETPALEHVSFRLPAGKTLGIAGPTGCGKTTLISLLMKLYEPPRGSIFIDGVDICDIPAQALRAKMGYVAQDGFLFSSSIDENIVFYSGRTEAERTEAAKLAYIDREIREFPEQYETQVGERGTHLSGGQKQRIALARALVRDPSILILDDTLSAVDNITEAHITEALNGVLKHKTSLVISHRLSALEQADQIIYIDHGTVTESGTHVQLLEQGGDYALTWNKQKQGGGAENA